jgi:hypothetical protein
MEADTALVRADRAVKLYSEAAVYLNLTVIVCPRYSEFDYSFGFYDRFDNTLFDKLRALFDNGLDGFENLTDCLMEFGLARVSLFNALHKICEILVLKAHMYDLSFQKCGVTAK